MFRSPEEEQQAADAAGYEFSKEAEQEGEAVGLGHLEQCLSHIAGFSSDLADLGSQPESTRTRTSSSPQPPDLRPLRICSSASAPLQGPSQGPSQGAT